MKRETILVLVFLVVVASVIGVSQFLRAQPPVEIEVVVSPLAADWVSAAAEDLNATQPLANGTQRFRINVVPLDDLEVWQDTGDANWRSNDRPSAWMPATGVSVDYARERQLPLEAVAPSLAQTPLIWGGFGSRVTVITLDGSNALDWSTVSVVVEQESWSEFPGGQDSWGFVKLAIPEPTHLASGYAVLVAGGADFGDTTTPTDVLSSNSYRDWMTGFIRSVPSASTIGNDPAATMASRGPSAGEIALLPESQWLKSLDGLLRNEDVAFSYPDYQFVFDFPLVRWDDTSVSDAERSGVEIFAEWLLDAEQQTAALDYGLRPVSDEVTGAGELFTAGQPFGINPTWRPSQVITPPPRNEAVRLLGWFDSVR